jgi:tryptophan halogenase
MKKIVVVGGGTVGWLTALFVRKYWENADITLIASSKIGILGAGEGTTPNFPGLLTRLGIDEKEFIEKTGCTKKYGIEFINWRGDNKSFKHNFQKNSEMFAYHFDARLVAKYLQDISEERNVNYIDGLITGFNEDEFGINQIVLEDGSLIDCDFIFDCSGFQHLIIGKHFKAEWKSYEKDLVCNSAIAFFLPQTNPNIQNEKTWTQGIAMKHGWIWGAPLKHRWGCGYVYSDKYVDADTVLKEAEEYYGQKLEVVKHFKFKTGTYKKVWIKNCVAIGLASSFLEPMEATSLMTSIMFLNNLKDYNFDEKYRDVYNDRMLNINEQNMLFVRHHYTCDRVDTQFWLDYKNNPLPEKLKEFYNPNDNTFKVLRNLQLKDKLAYDVNISSFNWDSWSTVHKGKSKKYMKNLI